MTNKMMMTITMSMMIEWLNVTMSPSISVQSLIPFNFIEKADKKIGNVFEKCRSKCDINRLHKQRRKKKSRNKLFKFFFCCVMGQKLLALKDVDEKVENKRKKNAILMEIRRFFKMEIFSNSLVVVLKYVLFSRAWIQQSNFIFNKQICGPK